jgi:hypothetical protein
VYKVLLGRDEGKSPLGRPEGNRPLGRPRFIWEDNIIRDIQEMVVRLLIGLSWLRIGRGGGHL